jgi:hypothetical protein
MRVIPPRTITPAMLTSSVAEPDSSVGEVSWLASTNYTLNTYVIRTTTHSVYQNILAGADSGLPENTPLRWLLIGPTNKYRMFDTLRNSQTTSTSNIVVSIALTGRIDSVAVMGIIGSSVTVDLSVSGSSVYSKTTSLSRRNTTTWSNYYFNAFTYASSVVLFDLPPYSNATLTVTVTTLSGSAAIGALVIGQAIYLGVTETTAESEALNFSTITRNFAGDVTLVPRRSIPRTQQVTFIDKSGIDKVVAVRSLLNAAPAVWSGVDDNTNAYFEALLILGIYKQFTINMAYPTTAKITLQLEEI